MWLRDVVTNGEWEVMNKEWLSTLSHLCLPSSENHLYVQSKQLNSDSKLFDIDGCISRMQSSPFVHIAIVDSAIISNHFIIVETADSSYLTPGVTCADADVPTKKRKFIGQSFSIEEGIVVSFQKGTEALSEGGAVIAIDILQENFQGDIAHPSDRKRRL